MKLLCLILILGAASLQAQEAELASFGTAERTKGGLIGMFYDLKQNQKGVPTPHARGNYTTIVGNFIDSGWDESLLKDYYCVTRPLYATEVFIPYMDAAKAPEAFGVANVIKPRQWMVHYKGQVRAKVAGRYRFMGLADDVLAAAVNGKTVMVGCHRNIKLKTTWTPPEADNYVTGPCGQLTFGNWFTVKEGEIFDLDVLIGEIPGSGFGAWLMFQKDGETYEAPKDREKHTKFPVFQLVNRELDPERYKWAKTPFFSIATQQFFEGVE